MPLPTPLLCPPHLQCLCCPLTPHSQYHICPQSVSLPHSPVPRLPHPSRTPSTASGSQQHELARYFRISHNEEKSHGLSPKTPPGRSTILIVHLSVHSTSLQSGLETRSTEEPSTQTRETKTLPAAPKERRRRQDLGSRTKCHRPCRHHTRPGPSAGSTADAHGR